MLREGYSFRNLRSDVLAGLVVGIVALPLSMALAIASGVGPQHGLYTAIVAGALTALLGGSRCQVSGPTAAFVVILLPIVNHHGIAGLMCATVMAGMMMAGMGLLRLGRLIQFVPYPVTTGFTAGIAVVIATGQVANFLGLSGVERREHFHEVVLEIVNQVRTVNPWSLGIGAMTLLLLVLLPRILQRVPAPLLAVGAATAAAFWLNKMPGIDIATIAKKFSYPLDGQQIPGIPPWPPTFCLPWNMPGPDGRPFELSLGTIKALINPAIAICMLGAIESLLSAVAADAMAGTRHDPDAELLAQGTGNIVAPFLGGFAATGAIARTATNIRSGARSPMAAVVHAGFLLAAIMLLAPVLGEMPMAAMAALLLMVAWRMSDVRHFVRVLKTAPAADIIVLLTCFGLTVVFDMVVGVMVGFMLAGLLFMRRMSELSGTRLVRDSHPDLGIPIPPGVLVYEIEGPLFFGAAERAMNTLHSIGKDHGVLVLDVDGVPTIDATGLVNLQSVLQKMKSRMPVVLTGVHAGLRPTLQRAQVMADDVHLFDRPTLKDGVVFADELVRKKAAARAALAKT